jgi:putative MATE family efflux protein
MPCVSVQKNRKGRQQWDVVAKIVWTDTDRRMWALAVPAFGALIAEPLYVLADTAVVGHLGTSQLGGLALAAQVLLTVHSGMIFLAYGTTASVSRLAGAGRGTDAARQGIQSMWLAGGLGIVATGVLWVLSDPLLELLGGQGEVLIAARTYLRISLFGLPAMLLTLAGVGYLRGVQDTVRPLIVAIFTASANLVLELIAIYVFDLGIGASAATTVIAQWAGALIYLGWVRSEVAGKGASLMPDATVLRSLLNMAGDLFVRTAALRLSFVVAVAAAARIDDASLASHEIAFVIWNICALALDAVAIAAQSLVGFALGSGDEVFSREVGRRSIWWGLTAGILLAILIGVGVPLLPRIFSSDAEVVALSGFLLVHVALSQPLNGVVFALDGVLIGAGDLRFLAIAMSLSAALFIPAALAVPALGWGVGWLWGAVWLLMITRGAALLWRYRSGRWVQLGAVLD